VVATVACVTDADVDTTVDGAAGLPVAAPPQEPPPHGTPTRAPKEQQRLQFLDAVRGIAAFTVAVQHAVETVSPSFLKWSHEVFRPGEWGVVLFFVSSGFIIPVSLDRYRSVGRFWVGRFFRLYPLYWAVVAGAWILFAFDRFGLPEDYRLHWVRASAANLTMAQEFIGQPHVLGQAWTLSYEFVFYGLVSLLFLVRLDKYPGWILTVGLATAVGAGTWIPMRMLTEGTGADRLAVLLACAVAAAGAAVLARRSLGAAVAAAGFAVAIVLLVANRNHPAWFSALLLSSMFVGWVLHRWTTGGASTMQAVAAVGGATVVVVVSHAMHFQVNNVPGTDIFTNATAESITFVAAYAVFVAFLALRRHGFPRPLRWLGEVSYSVYLVHGVVLVAVPKVGGDAAAVAVWLAATLVVSWITYRLFERPFQEVGRRVARRVASNAA
jgi:peptidoglycan/LPS O-acetylase OafA/YrhL